MRSLPRPPLSASVRSSPCNLSGPLPPYIVSAPGSPGSMTWCQSPHMASAPSPPYIVSFAPMPYIWSAEVEPVIVSSPVVPSQDPPPQGKSAASAIPQASSTAVHIEVRKIIVRLIRVLLSSSTALGDWLPDGRRVGDVLVIGELDRVGPVRPHPPDLGVALYLPHRPRAVEGYLLAVGGEDRIAVLGRVLREIPLQR